VREPQAFLMDEPLSNLDAKLRVQMRSEIGSLQRELGVTTIYVTHDQVEAMTMGDRVAVMRKGELQQVAPPQELYDRPVSLFVAGFIGSPTMNMMEATVEQADGGIAVAIGDQRLVLDDEAIQVHPALKSYTGKRVVVGIRPEDMEDAALKPETPRDHRLLGKMMLREALGSEINAHVEIEAPPVLTEDTRELAEDVGTSHHLEAHEKRGTQTSKLVGRFDPHTRVQAGDDVEMAVDTRAMHFFDIDSGLGIYDGPVSLDARRNGKTTTVVRPQEDHDEPLEKSHAASA
jgi:multiple sugar transport system ATP-binding protein